MTNVPETSGGAATEAPKKNSAEWWRSDAAYPHRCAKYIEGMLLLDPSKRKELFSPSHPEPEWPAAAVYDAQTDEVKWIEITSLTHIRDLMRGEPIKINAAAIALVDNAGR